MSILPSEIINLLLINKEESNNYSVKLFEVYEDSEFVHLVLEMCKGENLKYHLEAYNEQNDSFDDITLETESIFFPSEKLFKKIMRQILYSVKTMHELGIVHRDLKLDNIMWDH